MSETISTPEALERAKKWAKKARGWAKVECLPRILLAALEATEKERDEAKILKTDADNLIESWKFRATRAEAELTETKKNLESLRVFGDIMQRAIWPHDDLEIREEPGTRRAPQIVRDWREFVAKHLSGKKR